MCCVVSDVLDVVKWVCAVRRSVVVVVFILVHRVRGVEKWRNVVCTGT